MHWFKRNIGDYHKKAGRLSMLQHGAYTLLMDSCYDREQFPTMEEAIEWIWASSKEEIEAVEFVLSRFFTLENGVYTQKRMKAEIEQYHEKAETNKRIAIEREAKRKGKSTKRAQDVHESPPNQEPVTSNQEPVIKDKCKSKPKAKRFSPPSKEEAGLYFLELKNANAAIEGEKFVDYWTSVGWTRGRTKMKDWKASARTWNKNNFGAGSETRKRSATYDDKDTYNLDAKF